VSQASGRHRHRLSDRGAAGRSAYAAAAEARRFFSVATTVSGSRIIVNTTYQVDVSIVAE
jgi:hypothetical protein